MNAIVYPAPVVNCQTSPTHGVRRNAGRASGGALGRRLLVRQEKEALYYLILSLYVCLFVCVCVCVCVCIPSYSACQAHSPYCIAVCGLSCSTILTNNNLTHNYFSYICLFQFSTCFEQPSAHHPESQLYLVYVTVWR